MIMGKPEHKRAAKRQAVALKYDQGDAAPRVIAKGEGYVHNEIIKKAEENDVAVISNPELIKELTKLDLGEGIPPELYEVVAQVLIFISELDRVVKQA